MTMKRLNIAILGLSVALAAACASSGPDADAIGSLEPTAAQQLPPSGLGPQALEPGECGLFLWSKTDVTKFIFYSQALSGTAMFKPADETLQLEQIAAGGTIFGQFNTEQGYRASNGSVVELSFQPGEELTGGQRITDGLMTIKDTEGWRTKLPVLGIRACMPES